MDCWLCLCSSEELDLERTFNSDQTHLWEQDEEKWNGVIGGFLISLRQDLGMKKTFANFHS